MSEPDLYTLVKRMAGPGFDPAQHSLVDINDAVSNLPESLESSFAAVEAHLTLMSADLARIYSKTDNLPTDPASEHSTIDNNSNTRYVKKRFDDILQMIINIKSEVYRLNRGK